MFVNHLCEAKGEQDGKADEAEESFGEFVIAGGDPSVALDVLGRSFLSDDDVDRALRRMAQLWCG